MYPHKFGIKRTSLIPVKYLIYSYKFVRAKNIGKHSTLIISFLLLTNNKMINMHIHACTNVRYLTNRIKFQSSLFRKNKISNRLSIKNNENENLLKFFISYRSNNSMNFIHIINIIIIIIIIIITITTIIIMIIIIIIIITTIIIIVIIIIILLFNFYIWNLIK